MVGNAKMKRSHKRKVAEERTEASNISCDTNIQVNPELSQDTIRPCDENPKPSSQQHSSPSEEIVQQDAVPSRDASADSGRPKKVRGQTRVKSLPVAPESWIHVQFNDNGEVYGDGSVSLSSYLGPLVREHVPVTLPNWKKLGEDIKFVMWEAIQARFNLDEEWQKKMVLKQMRCLWRRSKSVLMGQILAAKTEEERLKLKPKNFHSKAKWKKFVKEKTRTGSW